MLFPTIILTYAENLSEPTKQYNLLHTRSKSFLISSYKIAPKWKSFSKVWWWHSALLRQGELNFVMNMLSWIPWQHVWLYRISSLFPQMLHLRLQEKNFPRRSCVDTSHSKFAQKSLGNSACTEPDGGNQQSPGAGRVCMNQVAASWLQKQ